MTVTRLVLVRHGQTPSNVARALDTERPGAPLTDLGRQQARALLDELADLTDLGVVAASPLLRTQQTATPLAERHSLPVRVVEGLEEVVAGRYEMRSDEVAVQGYLDVMGAWAEGDLDRRMPDAEDGHAFAARYDAGVAEVLSLAGGASTALLVSHGAAIRCWCALRVENVTAERVLAEGLANTGVVDLRATPGGWQAVSWQGEPLDGVPHVPPASGPAGEPVPED